MFALLPLAPFAGLALQSQVPAPGTQRCPDGSVVLAKDTCPLGFPDHRYLLSHEPSRREIAERWWCGSAREPNEVRIVVELRQPDAKRKAPYYVSRLTMLSVNGQKPSARLLDEVGARVESSGQVVRINTRCLNTPSQGTIGVLTINSSEGPEQRTEIELRP